MGASRTFASNRRVSALLAGGHSDDTLTILAGANHLQLEAAVGDNAERPTLQRFVPEYAHTIHEWLPKRLSRVAPAN